MDRNTVGFWFLGLVNNFSFVVFISAAEDLLSGYAGVILLCTVLPGLITKLTASMWLHRFAYTERVAVVAISVAVSMVVVALTNSLTAKLFCLVLYSLLGALGEMSFLALTSHYPEPTIGAWSSGTGMAGIAGSSVYFFLRQNLRLSPSETLLALAVVPLVLIILYRFVLDQRHTRLPYAPVLAVDAADVESKPPVEGANQAVPRSSLWNTLLIRCIFPLGIVYFAEYSINEGVLGTFRASSFRSFRPGASDSDKSHRLYTWLQLVYQVGVFVSRSSIGYVKISSVWAMPLLQVANLILLTFASIYSFLPSPAVVTAVVVWEGLLGGGTYVNTFWKLRTGFPPEHREWALAVVSIGDTFGIALAAIASIWLEQFILREQKVPKLL